MMYRAYLLFVLSAGNVNAALRGVMTDVEHNIDSFGFSETTNLPQRHLSTGAIKKKVSECVSGDEEMKDEKRLADGARKPGAKYGFIMSDEPYISEGEKDDDGDRNGKNGGFGGYGKKIVGCHGKKSGGKMSGGKMSGGKKSGGKKGGDEDSNVPVTPALATPAPVERTAAPMSSTPVTPEPSHTPPQTTSIVRIIAPLTEGDHYIDLAEVVVRDPNGNILLPVSSTLSSIYNNDVENNGPEKCHDGDLATACASNDAVGSELILVYSNGISMVSVFNRVNCLTCASRIVGGTIEVDSSLGTFTDTFYPLDATIEGSVYHFYKQLDRVVVDGIEQTEFGTLDATGVFSRVLLRPASANITNTSGGPRNRLLQDDRVFVSDENRRRAPYNGIGLLEYTTSPGVTGTCTGIVISRTAVLTRAHCLVPLQSGQLDFFSDFRFVPGGYEADGISTPFGAWTKPLRAVVDTAFQGRLGQNDIGLLWFPPGGHGGFQWLGDVVHKFSIRPTPVNGALPADRTSTGEQMIGPDNGLGFPGILGNRMTLNPAFPDGLGFIKDVTNSVVGSSDTTLSPGQSGGAIFSARDKGGPEISSSSCVYAVMQGFDDVNAYQWERTHAAGVSSVVLATLLNTETVQKITAQVQGLSLCPEFIPCGDGVRGNTQCPASDMMEIDPLPLNVPVGGPPNRLLQQDGQCCDSDGECKDSCESCVRTNQQCGGQNYEGPERCCNSSEECSSAPSSEDPTSRTCQVRRRNQPNFPDPDPSPGGLCCPPGITLPIPTLPTLPSNAGGGGVFLPPPPSCPDSEVPCGNTCCAVGDICYDLGPTNQVCLQPNIFPPDSPTSTPTSPTLSPTSPTLSPVPATPAPTTPTLLSSAPIMPTPVPQASVTPTLVSPSPTADSSSLRPSEFRDCLDLGESCVETEECCLGVCTDDGTCGSIALTLAPESCFEEGGRCDYDASDPISQGVCCEGLWCELITDNDQLPNNKFGACKPLIITPVCDPPGTPCSVALGDNCCNGCFGLLAGFCF